ncbi:MAG: glycosyltransferase family 2 protein [Ignavibacteriae bacterium]|nr:glycosyltransferase family 2 protein [Ignavibacteriota bacterium]
MIQYSVVVPIFNGEKTVEELYNKIEEFFVENKLSYEILFVYDCGPDNSWNVLKRLKDFHPNYIKLIKLSRNFGQHNALICGFEHAKGNFVITIDEDLQQLPADIIKLINKQKENDYDVVYGKYKELKHSLFRNISSQLFKRIIKLGVPELHGDYSALRLIKTSIAKSIVEMRNSYTFLDGYIAWITTHISSCQVSHSERKGGNSSYNLKMLMSHSINIFVTFSNYPIKILTKLSISMFIITLIYAVYIVIRKVIFDDLLIGYPSLVIIIGLGLSSIMLALGIIGEYIYRINLKTTKRPNYNIKEIL